MDSLTQLVLGAAVGVAVMGRRTAVWKAALWGGICGTLPDLDALIDHGDPIANMTLHRTESHALLFLTLAAPLIGWLIARLHGERMLWRRWAAAAWLALTTHPLLDAMTVYGTQLGLPFTDHPFYVGSIFIIDPLYTVPLIVGLVAALLWRRTAQGLRWNAAGLALSTAYLAWSAAAQWQVEGVARQAFAAQGVQAQQLLVTPMPFNTVLWRVLAITPQGYAEGFHRLGESPADLRLTVRPRGEALARELLPGNPPAQRSAWFSHGFYKVEQGTDGGVLLTDLRMGWEPFYSFAFRVAERGADGRLAPVTPRMQTQRPDVGASLRWLGRRIVGSDRSDPQR